jgi:hypothetical protein
MADEPATPEGTDRGGGDSPGEVIDVVVAYAKQETLGPLRGAGRWLGAGVAGSLLLGLGSLLILLGLLRLLQTEWDRSATGSLSWLSYLIVLVVAALVLVLVLKRINREPLNPPITPDQGDR